MSPRGSGCSASRHATTMLGRKNHETLNAVVTLSSPTCQSWTQIGPRSRSMTCLTGVPSFALQHLHCCAIIHPACLPEGSKW